MSILILSHVAHTRSPYDEYLKQLDEDLILLTDAQFLDSVPQDQYVHVEAFDDYDENGYVDLRAVELYEKYRYREIISCYELDTLRAAQLREYLHLPGQSSSSAMQFRDKLQMKETVNRHRIPTPAFQELVSSTDLLNFIRMHGYPVVIKPINGAGAMRTYVIKNRDDLGTFMRQTRFPTGMMAESFVEADVYHVDGVVVNGEVQFICTSKYLDALLNYQEDSYTGGYLLHPTHPLSKRMVDLTKQVLAALDTPYNTSFHAEWFHTPDDEIIFCEIASRVGGGRIMETMLHTFGVDLYKAHIHAVLGLPQNLPTPEECAAVQSLTGRVLMLKKEGRVTSLPQEAPPPWVVHYEMLAKPGDLLHNPIHCVDLLAGYVVEGASELEIQEKLISITKWFERAAHWE